MNDALTSLVNDVYTLTNRPDLVGETLLAVRNATLKAHASDFYYKDLFETGVVFDYSNAQQSIEYKSLVPLWRALKYIRKCDAQGNPLAFFEVLSPDNIFDSYGITKENVCYVAGVEIQIRSVDAFQYALLGCYIRPDVTPDNYTSWIADEHPAAIIYEAAATVFKTIGYDEQTSTYANMVQQEYQELKATNIVAVGY